MFVAQMETENFTFVALGRTKGDAVKALKRGWVAHVRQYGGPERVGIADPDRAVEEYGTNVFELNVGDCARDYEALPTRDTSTVRG